MFVQCHMEFYNTREYVIMIGSSAQRVFSKITLSHHVGSFATERAERTDGNHCYVGCGSCQCI